MYRLFLDRLESLAGRGPTNVLQRGLRGVEKESLRVTPQGGISTRDHPAALGSALTHPWITTDFSEALIELITPPVESNWETLKFLCDVHQFVYANIDGEMLWSTSMPCAVPGEDHIPIARYGNSNVGQMKEIYREGLSHRYGRVMQAIAGVHFNYSLPENFWPVFQDIEGVSADSRAFRDDGYFAMLRNFRRFGWLILYLFGASPAICKSFLGGRETSLEPMGQASYHAPFGTTLRMSDLGYRSSSQASIRICMNSLDEYVAGLQNAMRTPYPEYEKIGVRRDGEWLQLNANILQIENEYYGNIRPKQIALSGERPTLALERRGVAYVEVRALDVCPFDPVGVSQNEFRFLEAFLIYCLLMDSPPISGDELDTCDTNHLAVAAGGRDPNLEIAIHGKKRPLVDWAAEILGHVEEVSRLLDSGAETPSYQAALQTQRDKVADSSLTPSARVLEEMRTTEESFFGFAQRMSSGHQEYFSDLAFTPAIEEEFRAEALRSVAQQTTIEKSDDVSFEEYLRRYYED
ncbi:MAG: glutamate--cysteine ligase [Gammaproteobacteria bacterium]